MSDGVIEEMNWFFQHRSMSRALMHAEKAQTEQGLCFWLEGRLGRDVAKDLEMVEGKSHNWETHESIPVLQECI